MSAVSEGREWGEGGSCIYIIENEEYVRNVTGFKKQILKNTRNLRTPIPLFLPQCTNIRSGFQRERERERLNPFIRGSRNSRGLEGRGRSGCGWKTSGPHDRGEFKMFKKPGREKEAPVCQRFSLSFPLSLSPSSLFLTFNPCSLKLNNPLYTWSLSPRLPKILDRAQSPRKCFDAFKFDSINIFYFFFLSFFFPPLFFFTTKDVW